MNGQENNMNYLNWMSGLVIEQEGGEHMRTNIGTIERIIRAVVGFAIVAVAVYYQNWWGLVGLEIGLTGLVGWSPLYQLFDISTGPARTHRHGYA